MNLRRKEKVVNRSFRFVWIVILLTISYHVYNHYKTETLAEYNKQNLQSDSTHINPIRTLTMHDTVTRKIDSIKKQHIADTSAASHIAVISTSQQYDSVVSPPVVLHPQNHPAKDTIKSKTNITVLQGPSALFSRVFTIALGKTVPVNVLWADSGAAAAYFKLITIKANDIAGEKARFTIEDSFDVLLFSQTEYAAHDKIIIEDERHHLNISVLQVNSNSVVVNVASPLNETIVNSLQRLE